MDAPAPLSPAPADDLSPPARVRRGVQLPAWLAVLIVLIVAGGFAYLGWRMLKPPPPVDLSQYDSNEGGRRRWLPGAPSMLRPNSAPPAEGITLESNGNGNAVTPTLSIRFLVSGAKPNLIASTTPGTPPAPEDRLAVRARAAAIDNADARKSVGITDDQTTRLRAITIRNPSPIDAAGRAKLLDLWTKYCAANAATKPAAEKAVMDAVREIAATYTAARTASTHATAEQIRAVLNADQVSKLAARR